MRTYALGGNFGYFHDSYYFGQCRYVRSPLHVCKFSPGVEKLSHGENSLPRH
jgi:hypothetical protein